MKPSFSSTHIFADDTRVARTDNVWRSLHHPIKHRDNPILVADRDWEGYVVLQPGTVVYDEEGERFQMWYNAQPSRDKPDAGYNLCYATSTDGLHWDKPELGLVEFEGSTANNIQLQEVSWTHCVLKDDAEADAGRCYKLLYWPVDGSGMYAAFSPDGESWKLCDENPVVPRRATGDTCSVMRDPASGKYWLYHKVRTPSRPIRMIARMESDNFVHWEPSRLVLAPDAFDPPDTQFYGMSAFPYAGQYLGLLWVYHTYAGSLDVQVVSSRDGLSWDRTADRKLFMHLVPTNEYHGEAFDSVQIYPSTVPVEKDGKLWLYYCGLKVPHNTLAVDQDARIGLATFRIDGFCSFDATSPGHVVTRPFTCNGSQLLVNAATSGPNPELASGGGVRVQIEDEEGQPIPGFTASDCTLFCGDETDAVMQWRGRNDLSELVGRVVQLRFEIEATNLYSYRLGDQRT